MEDVYGNSSLNIMATASGNSHEGLSRSRDPKMMEICPAVQSKWVDAANDLFYVVECDKWYETMRDAPLLKRGWVLQERILSPGSLHFCDNELLWECREIAASETYPKELPNICQDLHSNVKLRELLGTESDKIQWTIDEVNKNTKGAAYDRWVQWMGLYCQTYLTKGSDKLVAISALAKYTRAVLNDSYMTGLWRFAFVDQLVWFALDNSRPKDYRAPSWSWASLDGLIYFASVRPHTIPYITLILRRYKLHQSPCLMIQDLHPMDVFEQEDY